MTSTMTATFETRRQAELAIERLVQEYQVDRGSIQVGPAGAANSAGEVPSGGDEKAGEPSVDAREDAALEGLILVTVDLSDRSDGDAVRSAFGEFGAERP